MNIEKVKFLFIDSGSSPDRSHKDKLSRSLSGVLSSSEEKWFSCSESNQENLSELFRYIESCDVVGFLISKDFIHSIRDHNSLVYRICERTRKRYENEGVYMIPIILTEIHAWENIPLLESLKPLPGDNKPISRRGVSQDRVRADLAEELGKLIPEIQENKKKLRQYSYHTFLLFQERLNQNDRDKKLKNLQQNLGIDFDDMRISKFGKRKIHRKINQELTIRTDYYKNHLGQVVSQFNPMELNVQNNLLEMRRKLGLTDSYAETLEDEFFENIRSESDQDDIHRILKRLGEEVTSYSSQIQQTCFNTTLQDRLLAIGGIVAIFLLLIGLFSSLFPKNHIPNRVPIQSLNQVLPSKPDGWMYLGVVSGVVVSIQQPLEKAVIHPPNVPIRGSVITATQNINIRNEAGTNNSVLNFVNVNEKVQVASLRAVSITPSHTEVWAEIHKLSHNSN